MTLMPYLRPNDHSTFSVNADLKLSKVTYIYLTAQLFAINSFWTLTALLKDICHGTLTLTHDIVDYPFHAYPNNEHHWYNKSIDHSLFVRQPTPVKTANAHTYMNAMRNSINIKRLVHTHQPTSNGTLELTPWYCHNEDDPDHSSHDLSLQLTPQWGWGELNSGRRDIHFITTWSLFICIRYSIELTSGLETC